MKGLLSSSDTTKLGVGIVSVVLEAGSPDVNAPLSGLNLSVRISFCGMFIFCAAGGGVVGVLPGGGGGIIIFPSGSLGKSSIGVGDIVGVTVPVLSSRRRFTANLPASSRSA